jgi:DNA end-binding protein Ku
MGEFNPAEFDDRYEAAVAELVKAKIEGKALPKKKPVKVSEPNDLLKALRESAGMLAGGPEKPKRTAANANAGTGREKARRASPKSATGTGSQRKAS